MITIPNPCKQKWSEMTKVVNGRFCDSCQHKVTDFSKFTDTELVDFMKDHAKSKICGRLRIDQINRMQQRENNYRQVISFNSLVQTFMAIQILCVIPALGQSSVIENTIVQKDQILDQNNPNQTDTMNYSFHGKIISGNSKEPVFGAKIQLDSMNIFAMSDMDGNFVLRIPMSYIKKDELYTLRIIDFGNTSLYKINLMQNNVLLEIIEPEDLHIIGLIVEPQVKPKTYFERIFSPRENRNY